MLVQLVGGWILRSSHCLLEPKRQLFQFFISLIQLVLDLLDFCLQAYVFVLSDVIGNLQIPIMILQIFLLHFDEHPKRLLALILILLTHSKDHLSKLSSF